MTRKISGHDGDLVVNDAVELDGQITGKLVIEPGGSAVINGSLTVSPDPATRDAATHHLEGELGSVISDIP